MRGDGGASDDELVGACLRGEAEAWEALVRRYANFVYSVPLRYGLSEDDAADVFQNTWSVAWERLGELRERSRLGPWLLTVAGRLAHQQLERRARDAARLQTDEVLAARPDPDIADQPEVAVVQIEESAAVQAAMARLPDRCRALLRALFYDPAAPTYAEIAAQLGVDPDTIGSLRGRCLQHLRELLKEAGYR